MQADAVDAGDAQFAGDDIAKLVQPVVEIVVDLEDLPAGRKKCAALGREAKVSTAALHERHMKFVFQRANLLADGALRNGVHPRRLGKTAGLRKVAKNFKRIDIHTSPFYGISIANCRVAGSIFLLI